MFSTLLVITTGALEGRSRVAEFDFLGRSCAQRGAHRAAADRVRAQAAGRLRRPRADAVGPGAVAVAGAAHDQSRRSRAGSAGRAGTTAYCGKFVVATLFANQLGAVDIVIASVLFPSATVADYAVAARLAALFTFFEQALLKRFAPRAGRLLQIKDDGRLASRIRHVPAAGDWLRRPDHGRACCCRRRSCCRFLATIWMRARCLMWLAIPSFVAAFYATSDRLLIIAGQANVALVVTASSFAILLASPFVTARWLGPVAIPVAMILAVAVVNPLVAVRARQLVGVSTFHWRDAILMACGSCGARRRRRRRDVSERGDRMRHARRYRRLLRDDGAVAIRQATTTTILLIFAARESAANAPLALSDKASQ